MNAPVAEDQDLGIRQEDAEILNILELLKNPRKTLHALLWQQEYEIGGPGRKPPVKDWKTQTHHLKEKISLE